MNSSCFTALFAVTVIAAADSQTTSTIALPAQRSWLTIASTTERAPQRLLDPVFSRYLLDRTAAPPKVGEVVEGTQAWNAVLESEGGFVRGAFDWAFTSVESDRERVVLAKLVGAARLYVDGAGFVGDLRDEGSIGVPIAVHAGSNAIFVARTQGVFRLELTEPETAVVLDRHSAIAPDLLPNDRDLWGSIAVINASAERVHNAYVRSGGDAHGRFEVCVDGGYELAPLAVVQWPFHIVRTRADDRATAYLPISAGFLSSQGASKTEVGLDLHAPREEEVGARTFWSTLDGSVQRRENVALAGELVRARCEARETFLGGVDGDAEHAPSSSGPIAHAFDSEFELVYGSSGDANERRELLERARFDQQSWWREMGATPRLVSDREIVSSRARDFGPRRRSSRNLVLYGNRDTNSAFAKMLAADCPIQVQRGSISIGKQHFAGDSLVCLFVYPASDEWNARAAHAATSVVGAQPASALVAVIGDTGARGSRLGYALAPLPSELPPVDWIVIQPGGENDGWNVVASGVFDDEWKLGEGGDGARPLAAR